MPSKIFSILFPVLSIPVFLFGNTNDEVELKLELPPVALVGTPMPIKIPKEHLDTPAKTSIKVPKECTNLAAGKPVTASHKTPIVGEFSFLTDGDKDGDEGYEVELAPGLQWIQIDLKKSYTLYAVALWHYHRQKRAYNDVIICVSEKPDFKDPKQFSIVFNNDYDNSAKMGKGKDKVYIETHAGKLIPINKIKARYIRFYSNGNTSDRGNHYIEAEVYGK